MSIAPIDLVTVSREFGSGGSEFAHALGARLDWPVLDRTLVYDVAERLELDARVVERLDEHPPTRLSRIAAAMFVFPPELPSAYVAPGAQLGPDDVATAVQQVIADAVRTPPLVVVGHGAQCLFHGRPGTLHVRLVAPVEERVRRIAPRLGCDAARAAAEARRMDDERGRYVQRYHRRDWRDPLLYDVEFNTGRVPVEHAAALVAALVRGGADGDAAGVGRSRGSGAVGVT
ncbi:cytidylate kinase [Gemmatimonadetes bacterium T265]|nr:cytidylate kinase [Gemmatimonadetes bacterium T265]